jgi:hypothetical protein
MKPRREGEKWGGGGKGGPDFYFCSPVARRKVDKSGYY